MTVKFIQTFACMCMLLKSTNSMHMARDTSTYYHHHRTPSSSGLVASIASGSGSSLLSQVPVSGGGGSGGSDTLSTHVLVNGGNELPPLSLHHRYFKGHPAGGGGGDSNSISINDISDGDGLSESASGFSRLSVNGNNNNNMYNNNNNNNIYNNNNNNNNNNGGNLNNQLNNVNTNTELEELFGGGGGGGGNVEHNGLIMSPDIATLDIRLAAAATSSHGQMFNNNNKDTHTATNTNEMHHKKLYKLAKKRGLSSGTAQNFNDHNTDSDYNENNDNANNLLSSSHHRTRNDDTLEIIAPGLNAQSQSMAASVVPAAAAAAVVPHNIASQLMFRTARGQRQYDVPQIECPPAMDGMERFACPTPDRQGRYRCIDDHVLCDGFIDCPEGEDEDRQACMFYKTTKAHLDVLADALLRWARGR